MTEEQELTKTLWLAADKLRSNMDAAEYKHVVLGLIFLKYISDAFDQIEKMIVEEVGADWENQAAAVKDICLSERVFYVPPSSRWKYLQGRAKLPTIGKDVDDAMDAIEKDNASLRGVLPKDYSRPALDKQRLGELIDLIGSITLSRANGDGRSKDLLGFVFEYFLGQFADAEGKKGGQFYTPQAIVKLIVEMLAPEAERRFYDGCCGSGGMFVQSETFIEMHEHRRGKISIYGQESNPTTYKLAKMNLAIRGIDAQLEVGDTFRNDRFPELKVDYVLANPPFNDSDYHRAEGDERWKYGVPPAGNANYAWLQHFISKLAPSGMAGIVLSNGSMSSDIATEGEIRRALIENDLVDCMVSLPAQLFYNTQIPACLWFLARDKTNGKFRNRSHEILFIDARELGTMISRRQKTLTDDDIAKITGAYHDWRGKETHARYADVAGFCKAAGIADVKKNNYILTPGRYIDFKEATEDGEAFDGKMTRLIADLQEQMATALNMDEQIKENLTKIGFEMK
jgi:type I restriction enzyme M protein